MHGTHKYPTPDPADPAAGYTARRTDKGSKPYVTLYGPDGQPVCQLGGNRALRASCVLVVAYGPLHGRKVDGSPGYGPGCEGMSQVLGLRAKPQLPRQVSAPKYGHQQDYLEFGVPVDVTTASPEAKADTSYLRSPLA